LHFTGTSSPKVFDGDGWEDKLFTLKLIEKSKLQMEEAAKLAEDAGVFVTCELKLGNISWDADGNYRSQS
jgi:hypothetical protein